MTQRSIWVVDNDPIDSQIIKEMLEVNQLAKDVRLFHSTDDVLQEIKKNEVSLPEIIVTENRTDKVNGWRIMEETIKQHRAHTKVSFHMVSEVLSNHDIRAFKSSKWLKSLSKKPLRLDDIKNFFSS